MKIIKPLVLLAVAAMSLLGCKKEIENFIPADGELVEASFVAAPVAIDTKTALNEAGTAFVWENDDVSKEKQLEFVEIQNNGENIIFRYNSSGGSLDVNGNAVFKTSFVAASGKSSYKYTAIYPYSALKYTADQAEVTLSLKANQSPASVKSYDKSADILVAKIIDNGNAQIFTGENDMPLLQFRRLVALGKITFNNLSLGAGELVKSISFEVEGAELAGKATYDITSDESVPVWSETSNKITVNYSSFTGDTAWFTCIPEEIAVGAAYKITVTTNQKVYTKSGNAAKAFAFTAGDITTIPADFAGIEGTEPNVTLPFEWSGAKGSIGSAQLAAIPGVQLSLSADYTSNDNTLGFKASNNFIIFHIDGPVGNIKLKGTYNNTNNASKIQFWGSVDGSTYNSIAEYNCHDNTSSQVPLDITTDVDILDTYRYIKIIYIKDKGNLAIGYISITRPSTDPVIIASIITGVANVGVVNATSTYTAMNFADDVVATPDGTIVTAASASAGTITYTVAPNYTGSAANGTITLTSAANPSVTKEIAVQQNKDYFTVTPSSIAIGHAANSSQTFTVKSTYPFTVSNPDNTKLEINYSGEANEEGATVTVTALTANEGSEVLSIGNIEVTRIVDSQTANVAVSQNKDMGSVVYTLVTDVNTLAAGDEIIIAALNYNYAVGTTQNKNNRASVDITKSEDKNTLTNYTNAAILTVGGNSTDGFTFYDPTNNGYLYAASSSSNYLRIQETLDNNGKWDITINAETSEASITAKGSYTCNKLRFNNSASPKLFSCYGSGQAPVCIYKAISE